MLIISIGLIFKRLERTQEKFSPLVLPFIVSMEMMEIIVAIELFGSMLAIVLVSTGM